MSKEDFPKDEEALKANLCEALYEEEGAEAYNECQSMTIEQIKKRLNGSKGNGSKGNDSKKKGLSKNAKIGIGVVGGLAVVGLIIYLARR